MFEIPKMPLAAWVDGLLDWLTAAIAPLTRAFAGFVRLGIDGIVNGLGALPPVVLMLIIGAIAWWIASRKVAIFSVAGLLFIWNLGLWGPTLSTIALVLVATFISILIGLPLGIFSGLSLPFNRAVTPVLDLMQTMPAFVYLIPAIPFFGLGPVAAAFATVIFSIPPSIRLTSLGIRQIDREMIEASDAFGTTTMQKLVKVQLPLALPTIMAGINQTIMLSLSMVVIAAMIGAGGLGGEVWRAIQRLRAGQGVEAGLAIVIIAMILDRITQNITVKKGEGKAKE
ncbi:MAG: proline/glycine betaine ABC transporter permease [Spirochaetaceae bacterium]|nr:MAG: proline/glycine betaine ABC transporter permease [Spirochaetaceae bacterium]